MAAPRLFLHEELMLLAFKDAEGTVAGGAMYQHAVAGALVAELVMSERVAVEEDGKHRRLAAVSTDSFHDPLLDEWLRTIAESRKPRRVTEWVAKIAGREGELKHRVATQLCRRGILRTDEDKVLWIFTRKIYPEVDPGPERELIERLEDAIFGEDDTDPRTAVLAAIADRCGILKVVFDKKRLRERKARLASIAEGSVAVAATADAIAAMQAAMLVTTIVPSIVVTTTT